MILIACILFYISELRIAFNLFDKDRDGSISLQEVDSAMETLGQKVDYEKVKESFKQVDLDGKKRAHTLYPSFLVILPPFKLPIRYSLTKSSRSTLFI